MSEQGRTAVVLALSALPVYLVALLVNLFRCLPNPLLWFVDDNEFLQEYDRRLDVVAAHDVRKRYDVGKKLGAGVTSEVFVAVEKSTGSTLAMKKIPLKNSKSLRRAVDREVSILKRLRHHHIVYLHEVCTSPAHVWVFLEFVSGGELSHYVLNQPAWTEAEAGRCIHQVLAGLAYLHSQGVVHRDIKLANLLRSSKSAGFHMKIADFGAGTSVELQHPVDGHSSHGLDVLKACRDLKDTIGTPCNMAPEVFDRAYGPQADVWSLGCVVYELLLGEPPFDPYKLPLDDPEYHLKKNVRHARFPTSELSAWAALSPHAHQIIHAMLSVDPRGRLSAWEALAHPFLSLRHRDSSAGSTTSLQAAQSARKTRKESISGSVTPRPPAIAAIAALAESSASAAPPAPHPHGGAAASPAAGSVKQLPAPMLPQREESAVFDIAHEGVDPDIHPSRFTGVAAYYDNYSSRASGVGPDEGGPVKLGAIRVRQA